MSSDKPRKMIDEMNSEQDQTSIQVAERKLEQLKSLLGEINTFVVAVSGGIDSTLLAFVAGRLHEVNASMAHAISPAVPRHATERVRNYAEAENWQLKVSEVGEFNDERYMSNPVDRCYYCKTNLYDYIEKEVNVQILSGTNVDDLSDFRPGLKAAEQHGVRHPYVEVGIDKATIREIAKLLGLKDLADLPASPCLSSRVETGIPIRGRWLEAIDDIEQQIRQSYQVDTVRCRIRQEGIVIEMSSGQLSQLSDSQRYEIQAMVRNVFPAGISQHQVHFEEYRMGSAFVHAN